MPEGAEAEAVKLRNVKVPQSTPPGGVFEAKVWATRSGKKAAVNKKFYRASGLQPAWQPRHATAVTGRRYAWRPSALARSGGRNSGRQLPKSHVATVQQWAGTEELPFEQSGSDVGLAARASRRRCRPPVAAVPRATAGAMLPTPNGGEQGAGNHDRGAAHGRLR